MTQERAAQKKARRFFESVEAPPTCEFCGRCVMVGWCCGSKRGQVLARALADGSTTIEKAVEVVREARLMQKPPVVEAILAQLAENVREEIARRTSR